jgi:aryl-alcohol dehydrogenase-like predicted oxidoreductase
MVVKPYRNKINIASKVAARQGFKTYISPDYLMSACEDNLKRPGPDYIDLYQIHFDDPDTPVEETVSGYVLVLSLAFRLPNYCLLVGQL